MTHFGQILKEERTHNQLTQKELAEKVNISDAYICKMEKGKLEPPSREVTERLADVLGMPNRPVTLYVSPKDKDALQRFAFLLEANVAGAKDVRLKIGQIEDEDGEAEEEDEEEQAMTMAHPAITLRKSRVRTSREEFQHLISSAHLTEEDEENVFAVLVEITRPILALMKTYGGSERKSKR